MLGRSGSWVGTSVAGTIRARFWYYQDFAAGSGPNLILTQNDNGTGGDPWDAANIVDGSAVVTDLDGGPIYDNAAENPDDLVKVDTHTSTAVDLNLVPAVGQGIVRVWYLYAVSSPGAPLDLEIAPRFVLETRSEHLDTRYLNAGLNLSDLTDAPTARTNLGYTNQTAGQVLLGDGGTTFTSDANLFFDAGTTRLGVGTNTPGQLLDLNSDTAPTAILRTQSTNVPDFRFQAARAANADLANADTIGLLSFHGRAGGATLVMGEALVDYMGDGTTRVADFVVNLSNAGAPGEVFRLEANGGIKTTKAAGAAYFDADGRLQSDVTVTPTELGYLDATSSIQTQLDGKQATGNYITALTGDVTAAGPGSVAATIANDAVTNAKLANMAAATLKGNNTAGAADPLDLTATEVTAMLNVFTDLLKGLVPASGGGTQNFLRADGNWSPITPPKSGVVALADGELSKAIVFATPLAADTYTPIAHLRNTVDADPVYQPVLVIAQDEDGFTVEWNDAIQGANYELLWGALVHDNP